MIGSDIRNNGLIGLIMDSLRLIDVPKQLIPACCYCSRSKDSCSVNFRNMNISPSLKQSISEPQTVCSPEVEWRSRQVGSSCHLHTSVNRPILVLLTLVFVHLFTIPRRTTGLALLIPWTERAIKS